VYFQLDLNLLTWISGDPKLIGNFGIAINLINMIMTVPFAVVYLLLPSSLKIYKKSTNQLQEEISFYFGRILCYLGCIVNVWRLDTQNRYGFKRLIGENYRSCNHIICYYQVRYYSSEP
jgi:hypothetical protein